MEDCTVNNDHPQYPLEFPRVIDDEVKPRVQNQRLSSDHGTPPDHGDSNRNIDVGTEIEEL
jgi:hypothetical protein